MEIKKTVDSQTTSNVARQFVNEVVERAKPELVQRAEVSIKSQPISNAEPIISSVNNVSLEEPKKTIQDSNKTSVVARKYVDEVVKRVEQEPGQNDSSL